MASIARAWAVIFSILAAAGLVLLALAVRRRAGQRRSALAQRIREQLLLIESPANVA
jgi:hypothetical protein